MEKLAFIFLSVLTLGGAALVVWHRSVVHSAFALMATLFGIAGFFVLLDADFLAVVQVLLYVGGILVLILFGLMLTPPDLHERRVPRVATALVLLAAAGLWIGSSISVGVKWYQHAEALEAAASAPAEGGAPPTSAESANPTDAERHERALIRKVGLGFLSQEGYVVPFELSSILLLMALVGAVYIARRRDVQEDDEVLEG